MIFPRRNDRWEMSAQLSRVLEIRAFWPANYRDEHRANRDVWALGRSEQETEQRNADDCRIRAKF
jgi:hypothetical protein